MTAETHQPVSNLARRILGEHENAPTVGDEQDFCASCTARWPCDAILAAAEIEALEAKVRDLEADRARIDWLDEKVIRCCHDLSWGRTAVECVFSVPVWVNDMRSAIDASTVEHTKRLAEDAARAASEEA
jgi:hypothetical protein